jgi:anti-sigma-K factor RskA
MSRPGQDHFTESLAAYALGALGPDEAVALERHLEGCKRCRAELARLAPALQALPEAVEPLEPPRALRDRLMAEVRADARAAAAPATGRTRVLGRLRGAFAGHHWRPAAALAALLVVAAVIVGLELGGAGSGTGRTSTVVAGQAPGVVATVVSEDEMGRLKLSNVPDLPRDRVLEAWLSRDGEVEAVPTLFVPDGEGHASTRLGDLQGVDRVMVTTEPPGGSKAPTSAPIASVSIPRDG